MAYSKNSEQPATCVWEFDEKMSRHFSGFSCKILLLYFIYINILKSENGRKKMNWFEVK
jgi:hypothetical protein